jgi:hypothetical protein
LEAGLMNKRKIINDPVYGFININSETVFDLIEHPYFQRLRRIKQLGLTHFVYPGANHTRFQHALGTLFLINSAINVIRSKGTEVSNEEEEAVTIAVLLHDIGHGPFSHALEYSIVGNINHEFMSNFFMEELNKEFGGRLSLAIDIFNNRYPKKFLHELVASQLDMDRLDYLKRDSFFTGVTEGVIGSDRIIKMLNVRDDKLVIDAKGIYSIEKFLIARRLMYWQVYLHKTVIAAEKLLVKILKRAKNLTDNGNDLFATPALSFFLHYKTNKEKLSGNHNPERANVLQHFSRLDDNDIIASIKVWSENQDRVLTRLCRNFINRKLFKIELQSKPFDKKRVEEIKKNYRTLYDFDNEEIDYFVFTDYITNNAYDTEDENIEILQKNGKLTEITTASEIIKVELLSKTTKKYYLCYPKD